MIAVSRSMFLAQKLDTAHDFFGIHEFEDNPHFPTWSSTKLIPA